MVRGLVSTASRWLQGWTAALFCDRLPPPALLGPAAPRTYRRLARVVLSDEVSRTLFEDYIVHRRSPRGEEEIGWVLLGLREADEALVLAALPAGADRQAGVAHVRFNSNAQAVGAHFVRQTDRRLSMVGVVHTHPGTLRHPSDGDYQGDSLWVGQLRGGEGVFGIGTAGAPPADRAAAAHVQTFDDLCFCWYGLAHGDARYRRLPVEILLGPDLARPLHPVWETIETHADPLDALSRQLAKVTFAAVDAGAGTALEVTIPLAEPAGDALRVVLHKEHARYARVGADGETPLDPPDPAAVDRAVYRLLAEVAQQPQRLGARGLARAGR